LSRQTAVLLGQHLGRLAESLDDQDLKRLEALAGRLRETAVEEQVPVLAALAEELQQAVKSGTDLQEIVALTTELMELCRATQSAFLKAFDSRRNHAEQLEDAAARRAEEPASALASGSIPAWIPHCGITSTVS
jgi:hypothetical protein